MILNALFLIAAILAGNGPGSTGTGAPYSYELTVAATYADVSVTINGFEILAGREEGGGKHVLLLNGFLKPTGNALKITIAPAFPGQESKGQIALVRYVSGGGQASVVSVFERGVPPHPLALPANEDFAFDAPGTPELAIWSAEETTLADAGRAEIVVQLTSFQANVSAALDRQATGDVVALFQELSSNRDAALFLGANDPENIANALVDQLAPAVNDQKGMGVERAPPIHLADLTFGQVGRFVVVRRRDGGPVAGFLFNTPKGLDGLTVDRPVFGLVKGNWTQLQDLKLAR